MAHILASEIKPGNKYRIVQHFQDGTYVAVQGRVILSHDEFVSFPGAGKFNVHPHVGMPIVTIETLDD
jgi:uncharacterized Zn-finger protein